MSNAILLDGQCAVISAGAAGIGRAIADSFIAAGAKSLTEKSNLSQYQKVIFLY